MPVSEAKAQNGLDVRAASVRTLSEDDRTVEVIFATPTRVLRSSHEIGRFYEELVVSKGAVDLKRLNRGAPFLNAHGGSLDARSVMAAIVPGSAVIEGTEGRATVRFDSAENDADAEKVFRKIKAQILTGVSVGYRVLQMKRTTEEVDGIPVYRVTKWEPYEISVAPIPADIESKFRSYTMPDDNEIPTPAPETRIAPTPAPAAPFTSAPVAPPVDPAVAVAAAVTAERERVSQITTLVRSAQLESIVSDELVRTGASVDVARSQVLDKLIARDASSNLPRGGALGNDIGADSARSGIGEALLHRFDPSRYKVTDNSRRFASRSLLEVGEMGLELKGHRFASGVSKMERAALVLGLTRGDHTTSDFPLILQDAGGKVLRDSYTLRPPTFQAFSRRVILPDFKDRKVVQIGGASALLALGEGGEIQLGTVTEGREVWRLGTRARRISVTRQLLVNDDLDAMLRLPQLFGRSATDVESAIFYTHFLSNPVMGDTVALFHATHANLGTGVPGEAGISAMRTAMRKQRGLGADGLFLNLEPMSVLIPPELETAFEKQVGPIVPNAASGVNPFSQKLKIIVKPRLSVTSVLEWYGIADPAQIDTAEYGYLEGEEGPQFETRVGWEVEGVELKCRLDFGAKVIDHRAFYKSSGA